MHPHEILKMSVHAGAIMLKSGAETTRVEDTIGRIAKAYELDKLEVFVIPTGIFASAENEKGELITIVKRITYRSYHLGKIALVNNLSREIVDGKVTCSQSLESLDEIELEPSYNPFLRSLCSGGCSFFFTFIFGGNLVSSISSFVVGFFVYALVILMSQRRLSSVLINVVAGFLIAFFTLSIVNIFNFPSSYFDKIVIGSIMPFVPGVGITNAIRDILEGNYVSGSSMMMDAIFVAMAIATGVGIGIKIFLPLFGGTI